MCGIALSKNVLEVDTMLMVLKHRGLDGSTIASQGDWHLGFNRLAIVRRGEDGNQPLNTQYGLTVFNGEIYNWRDIYTELSREPKVNSEIGVIAELIGEHRDFEKVLDGYFSIVHLSQHGDTIVSRDLFGVTPLYYQMKENKLLRVASEKKAFWTLDNSKVKTYEVPPSTTLIFDREGRLKHKRVFNPWSLHLEPIDISHLEFLFRRAVGRRLVHSEVPITIALSGGIDSSMVLKAAMDYKTKDFTAITVVMDINSDEAKNAIRLCTENRSSFGGKIDLKVVEVTEKGIEDVREEINYVLDGPGYSNPVKWGGAIRNYFVAKHAPGTVILCGEGADEFACGYPSHDKEWGIRLEFKSLGTVRSMHAINLDRVNKCGMWFTKEFRTPFLDRSLALYMMGCRKEHKKSIIKELAKRLGVPSYIIDKPKYGIEEERLRASV